MSCFGRDGCLLQPPCPSSFKTSAQTFTFPYFWQKVDVCARVSNGGGAWVLCEGRGRCVRLRRPRPAAPPAPCCGASLRLARCAGKRCAFPRLRALSGSNPLHAAQTKTAPLSEPFQNLWWAMRDSNPQPCACKAPALTVAPIARENIVYRNLSLEATMGFVFYPTCKRSTNDLLRVARRARRRT